jgi:hypothetical protein
MRPLFAAVLGLLLVACNAGSIGEFSVTHTTGAALGEDAGATIEPRPHPMRPVPAGSTTGVGASRAPGAAGDAGSRFRDANP